MSERERLSGRLPALRARAGVMRRTRAYFDAAGFVEVDTPLRVPSPGLEVHLRAVPSGDGYLITSPEYQMKRLLAGGMQRIYTICKCFRAGEEGDQHSSEFTMLEWYRANEELDAIAADVEGLVAAVAEHATGRPEVTVRGRRVDVAPPWQRITVADAMAEHAGVAVRGDETVDELRERVVAAGVDIGTATAWDDIFYCAFVSRVDPALTRRGALLLTDWPIHLGALARKRLDHPVVVERFEAYVGGVELANAFGELTDPVEQRARLEADLRERRARGLAEYPIDERFLSALADMPASAGVALGVDRLVMLACGVPSIRDVLAFAGDEL